MDIQPIETMYEGYTFRSRLEGRVAVFFNKMEITWHYEHEGYQTSKGYYVPDFWLPDTYSRGTKGVLFEVKPASYMDLGHDQLQEVGSRLGVGGVLLKGFELNEYDRLNLYEIAPSWDCDFTPFVCLDCKTVRFSYCCGSRYDTCPKCNSKNLDGWDSRFWEAYNFALRYRFW